MSIFTLNGLLVNKTDHSLSCIDRIMHVSTCYFLLFNQIDFLMNLLLLFFAYYISRYKMNLKNSWINCCLTIWCHSSLSMYFIPLISTVIVTLVVIVIQKERETKPTHQSDWRISSVPCNFFQYSRTTYE